MKMKKCLSWLVLGSLGMAGGAVAANFSTDFNSGLPAGANVYGNAMVDASGGVGNSGALKLTTADASQIGSFVLPDLDGGALVEGFTANFKARVGGGTGADGFGFSFATNLPAAAFGEIGAGTGLSIVFDTFNNNVDEVSPGIRIDFNGTNVAAKRFSGLRTGTEFVDVSISVAGGMLRVSYGGTVVFENLFVWRPMPGQFGFGARTGGSTDNHFIDDLNITTTPLTGPYVIAAAPVGSGIRPNPILQVKIQDHDTQVVDPTTVQVTLNGNAIPVLDITQENGVTTVSQNLGVLPSGSTNSFSISYATYSDPTLKSATYSFVLGQYRTLSSATAVPDANMDLSQPGFKVRVHQIAADLGSTIARAEMQLAGQLIDPATGLPYDNLADVPGAGPDGSFVETSTINYNREGELGSAGFFTPDRGLPGIPGITGSSENIAMEVVAYVALEPGAYTFGIAADDGFRLTTGLNPRDAFSTELASLDGARTNTVETLISFVVTNTGFYPFRLVYYQNQGAANVEWYSVSPSGQRVLLQDAFTDGSLVVFPSALQVPPYVRSFSPRAGATGVPRNAAIQITLADGTTAVDPATIQLVLNSTNVTPVVSHDGASGATIISYDPPGNMPQETTNVVQLVYGDTNGKFSTNSFSFVTAKVLQQLWSVLAGERSYMTTSGSFFERGLGFNPVTGHALLASRAIGKIAILHGETGAELGFMLTNGISGGTFPFNMIDVADDGAIFIANLTTASTTTPFKLYRWAAETTSEGPTLIYSGNPAGTFPIRLGDSMVVRGAGTNTQVLFGAGNPSTNAVLFTTSDGVNFNPTLLSIRGINGGDTRLGLAFGVGNTFYGIQTGAPLRHIGFDPASGSASNIASYTLTAPVGNIGPIGVDLRNGKLIGNSTSQTPGVGHAMNIYDLGSLSTNSPNAPLDSKLFSTTTGNFGTGAIDFNPDGSRVYTLDTANGTIAFGLTIRATLSVSKNGNQLTVSWQGSGSLLAAPTVEGPYSPVIGATSPFSVTPAAGQNRFFRVQE
jgi:hypothetical protein